MAEQPDLIRASDKVRVRAGPDKGRVGEVVRAIRDAGEPRSSATFLVRFSDGTAHYIVAANLERANSAEKGGKK